MGYLDPAMEDHIPGASSTSSVSSYDPILLVLAVATGCVFITVLVSCVCCHKRRRGERLRQQSISRTDTVGLDELLSKPPLADPDYFFSETEIDGKEHSPGVCAGIENTSVVNMEKSSSTSELITLETNVDSHNTRHSKTEKQKCSKNFQTLMMNNEVKCDKRRVSDHKLDCVHDSKVKKIVNDTQVAKPPVDGAVCNEATNVENVNETTKHKLISKGSLIRKMKKTENRDQKPKPYKKSLEVEILEDCISSESTSSARGSICHDMTSSVNAFQMPRLSVIPSDGWVMNLGEKPKNQKLQEVPETPPFPIVNQGDNKGLSSNIMGGKTKNQILLEVSETPSFPIVNQGDNNGLSSNIMGGKTKNQKLPEVMETPPSPIVNPGDNNDLSWNIMGRKENQILPELTETPPSPIVNEGDKDGKEIYPEINKDKSKEQANSAFANKDINTHRCLEYSEMVTDNNLKSQGSYSVEIRPQLGDVQGQTAGKTQSIQSFDDNIQEGMKNGRMPERISLNLQIDFHFTDKSDGRGNPTRPYVVCSPVSLNQEQKKISLNELELATTSKDTTTTNAFRNQLAIESSNDVQIEAMSDVASEGLKIKSDMVRTDEDRDKGNGENDPPDSKSEASCLDSAQIKETNEMNRLSMPISLGVAINQEGCFKENKQKKRHTVADFVFFDNMAQIKKRRLQRQPYNFTHALKRNHKDRDTIDKSGDKMQCQTIDATIETKCNDTISKYGVECIGKEKDRENQEECVIQKHSKKEDESGLNANEERGTEKNVTLDEDKTAVMEDDCGLYLSGVVDISLSKPQEIETKSKDREDETEHNECEFEERALKDDNINKSPMNREAFKSTDVQSANGCIATSTHNSETTNEYDLSKVGNNSSTPYEGCKLKITDNSQENDKTQQIADHFNREGVDLEQSIGDDKIGKTGEEKMNVYVEKNKAENEDYENQDNNSIDNRFQVEGGVNGEKCFKPGVEIESQDIQIHTSNDQKQNLYSESIKENQIDKEQLIETMQLAHRVNETKIACDDTNLYQKQEDENEKEPVTSGGIDSQEAASVFRSDTCPRNMPNNIQSVSNVTARLDDGNSNASNVKAKRKGILVSRSFDMTFNEPENMMTASCDNNLGLSAVRAANEKDSGDSKLSPLVFVTKETFVDATSDGSDESDYDNPWDNLDEAVKRGSMRYNRRSSRAHEGNDAKTLMLKSAEDLGRLLEEAEHRRRVRQNATLSSCQITDSPPSPPPQAFNRLSPFRHTVKGLVSHASAKDLNEDVLSSHPPKSPKKDNRKSRDDMPNNFSRGIDPNRARTISASERSKIYSPETKKRKGLLPWK